MEQWRDVVGYEGLYEVSNLGRVRNKCTGKILKPRINVWGYYQINLHKDRVMKTKTVHRLVAEAWIPRVDCDKDQVNHINEIKTENVVDNLEWCSINYNNSWGTHNERVYQTHIDRGYIKHPERRYLSRKEKNRLRYLDNRDTNIAAAKRNIAKRRVKDLLRDGREVPLWGKVIG